LRAAERTGRDVDAAAVEPGHRDLEADALVAEPVATGTRAFSKITARVGCAFQPILRSLAPSDSPGVSPSITSVEMPPGPLSPVRTITT